ncbi:hypothetical protein SLNWT_1845 [Streptomyces albus]|uniref:Uncharacterized protein n=1 Tax=Streptomyces albus (strain ATCC 21838 / DSM 41398 / FERM P-419 / JCM 4703 / NBRC 107858) TaxID=1081613 RepID=A0A0B5EU25_STRA4|nr:hypothetical protein SLNWT_1845 [Streptomyces albus]AOU76538.1 hypothetical protein SLNHY_1847 [Streptomyces albus]
MPPGFGFIGVRSDRSGRTGRSGCRDRLDRPDRLVRSARPAGIAVRYGRCVPPLRAVYAGVGRGGAQRLGGARSR